MITGSVSLNVFCLQIFATMCHWKENKKEAKLRPRIWQSMFFPCGCLGNIWRCNWPWTSEAEEGRGKTGLWRIRTHEQYVGTKNTFLHARENSSRFKIKHFYWCSVWKRKAEETDVGRKKSCMCECGLAWQGYPSNPGIPGSSTTGEEGCWVIPIPNLPREPFLSWWWAVCLLGLRKWKRAIGRWLMSECICPSDCIYPFLRWEHIVCLLLIVFCSHHLG